MINGSWELGEMWSGEKRQNQGKETVKEKSMFSNISFKLLGVFCFCFCFLVTAAQQEAQKLALVKNDEIVFPSVPLSPFLSPFFLPPSLPFIVTYGTSAISALKLPPAFAHSWFVKVNLRHTFLFYSLSSLACPFHLILSFFQSSSS